MKYGKFQEFIQYVTVFGPENNKKKAISSNLFKIRFPMAFYFLITLSLSSFSFPKEIFKSKNNMNKPKRLKSKSMMMINNI